jgi:uncharacterized protein YkwD
MTVTTNSSEQPAKIRGRRGRRAATVLTVAAIASAGSATWVATAGASSPVHRAGHHDAVVAKSHRPPVSKRHAPPVSQHHVPLVSKHPVPPASKHHVLPPAGPGRTPAAPAAAVSRAPAAIATCANADLDPDAGNVSAAAIATLCLVNQLRAAHGIGALADNAKLDQSARIHNDDMVARGYFGHDGPGGDSVLSRILNSAGYVVDVALGGVVGENIASATADLDTPRAIVDSWVASPAHLADMLNPAFRDSGVAVSALPIPSVGGDGAGATYTQDFGGDRRSCGCGPPAA